MSQLALFNNPLDWLQDEPEEVVRQPERVIVRNAQGHVERWYQGEAHAKIIECLREHDSTLCVMATGTGKTSTFASVIRDWPDGDCLVLAHRDELVQQAVHRIEIETGLEVELEQRQYKSGSNARVVVASVQSLTKARLERLGKDRFGLVVADEFHHYLARTYRRVWDFFNAKKLGVTATPDRGDEKALGQICQSVAYVYDISDAIEDGFLVPIRGMSVELKEIDLTTVKKTAGDLQLNQLDEEMVKAVEGICSEVRRICPDRRGIGFFPGVRSAELAYNKMNVLCPGSAAFISGETNLDERRQIVADYKAGKYQYLFNCQVACLDEETEILTSDGWVGCETISAAHSVANWYTDGRIEFRPPQAIEVRPRRLHEDMYSVEGPRCPMRITDDHRVLWRTAGAKNWQVSRAKDLAGKALEFPCCGQASPIPLRIAESVPNRRASRLSANSYNLRKRGLSAEQARTEAAKRIDERNALRHTQPEELSPDDCWLIGYWLGDGSSSALARGGTEHTLHNETALSGVNKWIETRLQSCGLDFVRREKAGVTRWSIGRGTGFGPQKRRGLYRLEPYLVKDGSSLLWALNGNQFRCVLQGFWMADGNHGNAKVAPYDGFAIANTNLKLLDLLQAIGTCRGMRITLIWKENRRGRGTNHKRIGELRVTTTTRQQLVRHRLQRETTWVREKVWCVKSDSSFIIARRRGRVFVTGNTEGFDAPSADLIIMGRPTLSRSLYAQMAGRGMRVLPGVIDDLPEQDQSDERKRRIALSAKADTLLMDFVGNAGKHTLIGPQDLLGGNYKPAEIERAKKLAVKQPGGNVAEQLKIARLELQRLAQAHQARVRSKVQDFDPFTLLGVSDASTRYARFGIESLTDKQYTALLNKGVSEDILNKLNKRQASDLIDRLVKRHAIGLASYKQMKILAKHGLDPRTVTFELAGKAIDYLQSTGWGRHTNPETLNAIAFDRRSPGSDG